MASLCRWPFLVPGTGGSINTCELTISMGRSIRSNNFYLLYCVFVQSACLTLIISQEVGGDRDPRCTGSSFRGWCKGPWSARDKTGPAAGTGAARCGDRDGGSVLCCEPVCLGPRPLSSWETVCVFQVLPDGPPSICPPLLPGGPLPGLSDQASCHQSGREQTGDPGDVGDAKEGLQDRKPAQ